MSTPIRTTLVGSYPIPSWLRGAPSREGLTDATAVVLALQQRLGIDLSTDGEISRFDVDHPETNGMIEYFVRPLGGVRTEITRSDVARFAATEHLGFRAKPAGVVARAIDEGSLDLVAAYRAARELSPGPLKFTLTSPYMLARTLLDEHYGDLRALATAIADVLAEQVREIDAEVVQVDEANVPGRPQDGELAAEVINRVLDAVPGTPSVHLCFGNYGGQRVQSGRMATLVPFFAALRADHVVLEAARHDSDDLGHLRELDALRFGVGVIDVKDTQVEGADEVAKRIEQASGWLGGPERIDYVHPDCGFWILPRSIADAKIAALTAGRDLFLGR
ncbi:methionine synthase [Actinomycetospora sp. NBRC 106375]|uniref:cobalamin-independent methionine synthase II family protein n=1 Tax=Actinomycetospora sp. NBRC 106375 TaxID=3032207 RepID=UPI0024A2F4E6|nr:cobalamin-independent methionine synthase II family protein [Actinomycetospora sp. NBRC 106375]GLZ46899.1 methionine synthase [Actinomycetospora sp. NBRC 106375]